MVGITLCLFFYYRTEQEAPSDIFASQICSKQLIGIVKSKWLLPNPYRLRWHHVVVVCAISTMTYVLIVVVVVAFVLAFVVLLSSRFFLLDETHHVIRQKKITVAKIVDRNIHFFLMCKCFIGNLRLKPRRI